jgi:uncharacterized iron-regulated protein
MVVACATPAKQSAVKDKHETYGAGTILASETGKTVSFEQMMADLESARVIYVGENHRRKEHHDVQLQVIKALHAVNPSTSVGMEMFARSYQPVLDQWSEGGLTMEELLRQSHWYANWRFDHELYRPILEFVKANKIQLVALNLPFHIPSKIRVGGIEHLADDEKKYLPLEIDTSDARHREYVESVFNRHGFSRTRFEDFYMAQCVWEDGMAEAVAARADLRPMVVVVGNGHIQYKYGIPERAHKRTGEQYRTIYLVSAGGQVDLEIADYVWITP